MYRNRMATSLMITLGFLLLCLGLLSSCGDDDGKPSGPSVTWQTQRQSRGSQSLAGVSALDATHVWAVGHGGTILFYDGSSWTAQASDTTDTLWGVSALDATHVWAVGDGGTILFYNGSSWTAQASDTTDTLRGGVSAVDETHVWAVGDLGLILFGTTE